MDDHSSPETDEKPRDVSEAEKPLKLFVGQVPKDWDEERLRPLFVDVGGLDVLEIVILRDHSAGTSKGMQSCEHDSLVWDGLEQGGL
jgi:hypothetical protein